MAAILVLLLAGVVGLWLAVRRLRRAVEAADAEACDRFERLEGRSERLETHVAAVVGHLAARRGSGRRRRSGDDVTV